MANKVTLRKGNQDFADMLVQLSKDSDEIAKRAIYDAAGIVADEVRKGLNSVTSGKSTGDLASSLGMSGIKVDSGVISEGVSFTGYDRNGTPNILKARTLESGSSKQKKHPFFRRAVNRARAKAEQAMVATIEKEINKRTK